MRAAYHTAHATTKSDMTQTHTGIDDRASVRRGSNGSSELNASTVKRTLPRRVEWGRNPATRMPGPLCTRKGTSSIPSRPLSPWARNVSRRGPSAVRARSARHVARGLGRVLARGANFFHPCWALAQDDDESGGGQKDTHSNVDCP